MPSKQVPIGSGNKATTTAEEAIGDADLRGKVAIVTGGYSGLGLETVRVLSNAGATLIVAGRDPDKARSRLAGLPRVEVRPLDLLDRASIDAFATDILGTFTRVHILVNNAGFMGAPLKRDVRGYESHFSANHLGHFQLTARLWPALCRADGARVISVSSRGHRMAPVEFSDMQFEHREYDRLIAYAQSKTAQALFSVGLDARGEGLGIRAFSVHPGSIITDLSRHFSDEELRAYGISRNEPHRFPAGQSAGEGGDFKTVEQGAATQVWCATSDQLRGMGGVYCENGDIAEVTSPEDVFRGGVCPWAVDPELAERLWRISEELSGASLGS